MPFWKWFHKLTEFYFMVKNLKISQSILNISYILKLIFQNHKAPSYVQWLENITMISAFLLKGYFYSCQYIFLIFSALLF